MPKEKPLGSVDGVALPACSGNMALKAMFKRSNIGKGDSILILMTSPFRNQNDRPDLREIVCST